MNRNLGNYDMVLGLSSSKINYQFKKMYQRKIIHSNWSFLTNSMGKEIKTLTNEEAENYWENFDTKKLDLEAKKEELVKISKDLEPIQKEVDSIDQRILDELDKKEWDAEKLTLLKNEKKRVKAKLDDLQKQVDSQQNQVDDLQAKVDEANLYDLGLIANIAEPKIDILSETSKELIFQISFKSDSRLFYTYEGKKAEYDLGANGTKYAFRVSIGKVRITSDKKIIEISEDGKETEKTLRDKGINDNDFTIQALFLDFENANIANYDSKSSTLPEAVRESIVLQAAIGNYFKHLANSDNPYVLGYGIHKNEVQEREKGLFYPTGVAYSTSHSRENRASTFNFLMLLNNHAFPSGNDAGVLPTSLMEYAQDVTATVNGVFGLNMSEFEANYISLLSNLLFTKIKSRMGSKCKSAYVKDNKKDVYIDFGWFNVAGSINLRYQGIQANGSNNGVDIKYIVQTQAKVHQEIKEMIGTVGVDWNVSTSGQADPPYNHNRAPRGHEGNLILTLKAGASGKLELGVNYSAFRLGFDTAEPRYKDGWDKFWDQINKVVGMFLEVVLQIETDIGEDLDSLVKIDNIGNALKIQNLEKLENKVILPISSVYTYKNVRVFGDDDKAVLLFDTSYGTVAQ